MDKARQFLRVLYNCRISGESQRKVPSITYHCGSYGHCSYRRSEERFDFYAAVAQIRLRTLYIRKRHCDFIPHYSQELPADSRGTSASSLVIKSEDRSKAGEAVICFIAVLMSASRVGEVVLGIGRIR